MSAKARYWCGILYPENMVLDWEIEIGDILQIPFCYCVHDKDIDSSGNPRKTHVHLMVVFSNTTTKNHAMSVLNSLSASGCKALSTIEEVFNVRHMYEYLIHNTDTCRSKGKYQYDIKCRKYGNNFDIGIYESLSLKDKANIAKEMCDLIVQQKFSNFIDFYMYVVSNYDSVYFDILKSYSGLFERLTKGNYQKYKLKIGG